jgi:hypothetical protein
MCALCAETVTQALGVDMICAWENSEKKKERKPFHV